MDDHVREEAAIGSLLTGLFDTGMPSQGDAGQMAKVPGVEFSDGQGGYRAAVDESGKVIPGFLTAETISQVKITTDGEERFFKKLDQLENVKTTGLKASLWVETDAAGSPKKNAEGEHEVFLCFPGYNGNPLINSPQTQSLHAIGDGELNPQVNEVPATVERFNQALRKALGPEAEIEANVSAHSMGSSNALAAAMELGKQEGVSVEGVALVEPVGASLAERKLRERDAETLDAVIEKTASLRAVTIDEAGNHHFSKSAQLEAWTQELGVTKETLRAKNMNTAMLGNGDRVDPNNDMVGEAHFLDATGQKNLAAGLVGSVDPTHALCNTACSLQENAPLEHSIGKLKEIHEAGRQEDNKAESRSNERAEATSLPYHLAAALEVGRTLSGANVSGDGASYNIAQVEQSGRQNIGVGPPETSPSRSA